ncbi:MAG: hypothetical protein JO002_10865 [Burkholderiaceae bacterium]|nr:hypothetical protein [Burkholderiaceae bacterium]
MLRLICLLTLLCATGTAAAQGIVLPWGVPTDFIAWEQFALITAPSGDPQTGKVEFETWASDQDIYASNPAQWPAVDAPKILHVSALGQMHLLGRKSSEFDPARCRSPRGLPAPAGNGAAAGTRFPLDGCIGEEVRRNWASFQYIVSNGLDSHAGLAHAYAIGLRVNLPADAIEFKGDWAKVSDVAKWLQTDAGFVRQHYYTAYAFNASTRTEVALLAFHISSKQIANWVWADFEAGTNPGRCDTIGCHDSFGAAVANVAPNQVGNQAYGACAKSTALQALLHNAGTAPVWNNYCLKGSQAAFIDRNANPYLLGNSVIEPLNAGIPVARSSCMTCHAYASFDQRGNPNASPLIEPLNSPVGLVDQSKMIGYLSNDFIWGISLPEMK